MACQIRQRHKCNGNLGSHIDNTAIKWSLDVWISCSAIRERCRPVETSWCREPKEEMEIIIPAENVCPSCAGAYGDHGI